MCPSFDHCSILQIAGSTTRTVATTKVFCTELSAVGLCSVSSGHVNWIRLLKGMCISLDLVSRTQWVLCGSQVLSCTDWGSFGHELKAELQVLKNFQVKKKRCPVSSVTSRIRQQLIRGFFVLQFVLNYMALFVIASKLVAHLTGDKKRRPNSLDYSFPPACGYFICITVININSS